MRKKNVNGVVKRQVADALSKNPDYTAKGLKKVVEKELREKGYHYKFTERTYLNLKKELLPKAWPTGLDAPWTIGACVKVNISADIIPLLLDIQKQRLAGRVGRIKTAKEHPEVKMLQSSNFINKGILTIRQACWCAKIYPTIIELAKKQYPDNAKMQRNCVEILARQYAHREKVAEILDIIYPDTSDIDNLLMQGDLSQEVLHAAIMDYSSSDETNKRFSEALVSARMLKPSVKKEETPERIKENEDRFAKALPTLVKLAREGRFEEAHLELTNLLEEKERKK